MMFHLDTTLCNFKVGHNEDKESPNSQNFEERLYF